MDQLPKILQAGPEDKDKVYAALTLAFASDPVMRFFLPTAADYLSNFERFAHAMDGLAFEHKTAFYTEDGSAAALWLPPGVHADDETVGVTFAEVLSESALEIGAAMGEEIDKYRPKENCWYLGYLGVDPTAQGRGLGAHMLKDMLRRCDQDGLPAYLESSNPRNISLYERHGFEVMGVINVGNTEPLTPMIRSPR